MKSLVRPRVQSRAVGADFDHDLNPDAERADATAAMRARRAPVQDWPRLRDAYATGGTAELRARLAASQVPAGADPDLSAGMPAAARMLARRRDADASSIRDGDRTEGPVPVPPTTAAG